VTLGVLVTAFLIIGSSPRGGLTDAQRAEAIDSVIRCPSCEDLSVAQSTAPTALAVRNAVALRVHAGESTGEIESFLEARYGPTILLQPPASGSTLLLWVLPIAAGAVGIAVLGGVFWRRRYSSSTVGEEDRALVAAALAASAPEGAKESRDGSRDG
jgi:cytochrome c-type biogenesis protein CcmH